MAKDKLTEYDATAANNTVVGDVNLAENSSLPSDLNNAVREVMSHQKEAFGSGTPLYVDQTNNKVGIGTASPAAKATIKTSSNEEDALLVEQSDGTDVGALRINNGSFALQGRSTSQPVQIQTHDGNEDIEVDPDGFIKMETAGVEALRIDSSQNVLVGVASVQTQTGTTAGTSFYGGSNAGLITAGRNGDILRLNRHSTDGDIAVFRKDGTTVGSIGTASGDLTIHGDVGIRFSGDDVRPLNSSGAQADNSVDLGHHDVRWQDLYLGGNLYLGGTGSANALSDYEIGLHVTTATPNTSGSITLNSSSDTLAYTKIGRLVLITGEVSISSVSSPVGSVVDFTVPFACSSLSEQSERAGGGVFWTENGGGYHVLPFLTFSGSIIRIFKDASAFSANDAITFGVSYITDS